MVYVMAILIPVLFVEAVIRLPFQGNLVGLHRQSQKAFRVITTKKISEHWKEKVVPVYAGRVFMSTFKLMVILILVFGIALLPAFIYEGVGSPDHSIWVELMQWPILLVTTVIGIFYYQIRTGKYASKRL